MRLRQSSKVHREQNVGDNMKNFMKNYIPDESLKNCTSFSFNLNENLKLVLGNLGPNTKNILVIPI